MEKVHEEGEVHVMVNHEELLRLRWGPEEDLVEGQSSWLYVGIWLGEHFCSLGDPRSLMICI